MPIITIDLPQNVDKCLAIEKVQRENITKAETIVQILDEYFKPDKEVKRK